MQNFLLIQLDRIKRNLGRIVSFLTFFVIVAIIIFNSGYALITESGSKLAYSIILGIIVLFLVLVLKLPITFFGNIAGKIKGFFKKPQFNFFVFVFIFFLLSFAVTMLVNFNISHLSTYFHYFAVLVFAFLLALSVDFNKFIEIFSTVLTFISIVSLVFFFFSNIAGTHFAPLSFVNTNGVTFENYFFIYFAQLQNLSRNCAIFWEPGIFSTYLIFGLVFELVFSKKTKLPRMFLFLVCLITTRSTAAYLLLLLFVPLFISTKLSGKRKRNGLIVVGVFFALGIAFYTPVINVLSTIAPAIFEKIDNASRSLMTRILSPVIDMQIFATAPFFGVGPNNADDLYLLLMPNFPSVDSQTSTSFWLAAAFGIPGLCFTLFYAVSLLYNAKKGQFLTNLIVFIIFMLCFNKEPHYAFVFSWMFLFILLKDQFPFKNQPSLNEKAKQTTLGDWLKGTDKNNKSLLGNISGSFLLKILVMVVGIFTVPVYSAYFNNEPVLGIWFTILSVLTWILTFDLGIGNGLKNKLAAAFVRNDPVQVKKYISSAYIVVGAISLLTALVGTIAIGQIDLNAFFNISSSALSNETLVMVVRLAFLSIIIEFFLKLILSIMHAMQMQTVASSLALISTLLLLVYAKFFPAVNLDKSIINLSLMYIFSINLPLLIATIALFLTKLRNARPNFHFFDKTYAKDIMVLGGTFFIIQLALLFINSTNEILITKIYGPTFVVSYQKYYKLFAAIMAFGSAISMPVWAAVAKAYSEKRIAWIRKVEKYLGYLTIPFALISFFLVVVLQIVFDVWLGAGSETVNYVVAALFAIYTTEIVYMYFVTATANGIGALKTQLIVLLAGAVLKIPLVLLGANLFTFNDEWVLVVGVNAFIQLPFAFFQNIENAKMLKKTEKEMRIA